MLPTDMERRLSELIQVQEIIGIKRENDQILVQASMGGDHKSPWMPYSLPFMGNTSIFAYPKIGMGGLVISESGENEVNRFLCLYDIANIFGGLGETDFKILFHNGDFIHHESGNLTINSASKVVVNTEDATINASNTVINSNNIETNGNNFTVNAGLIRLNGYTQVSGGFSQTGGSARSGYTATFASPITFQAHATANADITINGISFTGHKHIGVNGPTGTPQ